VTRDLSVAQNLRFAAHLGAAIARDDIDAVAEERALATLGLDTCEARLAGALSAGQQRRIAIARLLLAPKPVWLLDEPAASLDHESARLIETCIDEHVARGGIAVLTTHRPIATARAATRYFSLERAASCLR
jgi:heme exporter protein A